MFSFARKNQKFSGAFLLALFLFVFFGGVLAPINKVFSQGIQSTYSTESYGAEKDPTTAAGKPNGPSVCGLFSADSSVIQCVKDGINSLLYGIFYLTGIIISFELKILGWVMDALTWNNGVVESGWTIIRDVANLFFILVIIIIAFATVLQIETYGMRQLLPKLIFIALLLNFSLVICGFLINFSDAFGKTFINAAGGGAVLGTQISKTLGFEKIAQTDGQTDKEIEENVKNKISQGGKELSFLTMFLTLIVGIFAALVMIFVIGAGIFFMAVRQIALIFVVMLSPMALICLLIPFLNSYWNQWKEAFLKWVTFYPIYAFFIYVAIRILTSGAVSSPSLGGAVGFSGMTSPSALWNLFIASAFLCGAIMVAQKMSVAGAGAIGSFGKGALKTMTGVTAAQWAARKGKEAAKEKAIGIGAKVVPSSWKMGAELRAQKREIDEKKQKEYDRLANIKRDDKGNPISIGNAAFARKAATGGKYKGIATKSLTGLSQSRTKFQMEETEAQRTSILDQQAAQLAAAKAAKSKNQQDQIKAEKAAIKAEKSKKAISEATEKVKKATI